MKKAYLTQEIIQFYDDLTIEEIENHTFSINCIHCNDRIWFHGNIWNDNTPANFKCPYCDKFTINELKVYSLYKYMENNK